MLFIVEVACNAAVSCSYLWIPPFLCTFWLSVSESFPHAYSLYMLLTGGSVQTAWTKRNEGGHYSGLRMVVLQ